MNRAAAELNMFREQLSLPAPPAMGTVEESLFVHRRDAFVSPALVAFLAHLRTASRHAQAAE